MESNADASYMYYMLRFDSLREIAYYKTWNRLLRKGDKVTITGIDNQENPVSGEIISVKDHMAFPAQIPLNGLLLITEEECRRIKFPYEYEKIDGGLRLSRYIPHDDVTEIVIPNMIDGQRVIEIGDYAFVSRTELEKVEIQEGIERIGKGTFAECENLKRILLPTSLKSLGSDVPTEFGRIFYNAIQQQTDANAQRLTEGTFMCSGLTAITIPENVGYIGPFCFASCKHLKNIIFPDCVTDFNEGILGLCSSLKKIKFPKSLKEIGSMALGGCEQITEIRIPDGVKSLGQGVFASCSQLEKVYIPDSVTSMDETVFNNDNPTIFCDPESCAWQFAQNHCINHAKGEMYFESDWDESEGSSEDLQSDEMENQEFSGEGRDPIEITLNVTGQEEDNSEDEALNPDEEKDYSDKSAELKKNIEILDSTFSKYGLKVLNVGGLEYGSYLAGPGIKFFVEVVSESETDETGYYHIKINIYDKNGELIAMGSTGLDFEEFNGYDTFEIVIFHESIHARAARARIFFTK